MKTIINAVQSWTKKEIKNSTADWNQNDANAADYVKNKPDVVLQSDLKILENHIEGTLSDINENLNYTQRTKMDKNNPVGTGSFSMNRKSGTTVGTNSVAIGYNTTASGENSHAEGKDTTASGQSSHAEGYMTEATNTFAHAEGVNTTASGQHSHAEGSNTIASGFSSHAEGRGTVAQRKSQHVQGEYNILDTTGSTITEGKYVHIVGNGDSDTARSNAHTLDWNGVGWFQGGLKVGGTDQDDEAAQEVVLKGDLGRLPMDRILLKDTVHDGIYKIEMQNGNLVSIFSAEDTLIDFDYTDNGDGTYTITGWRGTYLGAPSTEMIIPNYPGIIV